MDSRRWSSFSPMCHWASRLAYVVVQHLDPTQKAMLTELLQRATAMPVREVTSSLRVEPDVVYVIAPNTELTVAGGRLHPVEPVQPRGLRLPIDVLFCSLARDQGERAIGVVLSGMGADGTLGLQAIKGQGGLTLAQEPASAQFDSMPKSAIAAGVCDIVAPAPELPLRILLVTAGRTAPPPIPVSPDTNSEQSLRAILGPAVRAKQTRPHALQEQHRESTHRTAHGRDRTRYARGL